MVLFYQPLKRKKVTEGDLGSDNESCLSQSILTNYKQKVYSQTQTYEVHRNEPNHAPKNGNDEVRIILAMFQFKFMYTTNASLIQSSKYSC